MIPKINHKYLIKCCGGESIGECIDYNYDDNDKKFYFFLIDGEEWWDKIYEEEIIREIK